MRVVALTWFKDQFIKCHDRAAQVKTWLPAQYSGPPTFLDQLVYDRALFLVRIPVDSLYALLLMAYLQSRTAARKELLDQATSHDECEKLYEESLWCLYALQDDLLQTDNPFMDEDRTTISTCTYSFIRPGVMVVANTFAQGSSGQSSDSSVVVFEWV